MVINYDVLYRTAFSQVHSVVQLSYKQERFYFLSFQKSI
ncbi:hypothetical protein FTV88_0155 [Heliorestis convoluta]|uniref:Uncharacterized protein n=1 Tax=Heliorestis convoluta TaxID=356322 RepID=A0A5Q2MVR2_9FIRM|nr:hypothetical protein FTV88_0155 [Heliorestis convoluta]